MEPSVPHTIRHVGSAPQPLTPLCSWGPCWSSDFLDCCLHAAVLQMTRCGRSSWAKLCYFYTLPVFSNASLPHTHSVTRLTAPAVLPKDTGVGSIRTAKNTRGWYLFPYASEADSRLASVTQVHGVRIQAITLSDLQKAWKRLMK